MVVLVFLTMNVCARGSPSPSPSPSSSGAAAGGGVVTIAGGIAAAGGLATKLPGPGIVFVSVLLDRVACVSTVSPVTTLDLVTPSCLVVNCMLDLSIPKLYALNTPPACDPVSKAAATVA